MVRFCVAGVVFDIASSIEKNFILDRAYQDFFCTQKPDINLMVYYKKPNLNFSDSDLVFDSEGTWKLYEKQKKYIYTVTTPVVGPEPYRYAVFNKTYTEGEIFVDIPGLDLDAVDRAPNPFEFPLSEVLMINYLADKRGIMVHSCGVDDDNNGYLFAGQSTHGKSTTAAIWEKHARILNDDRIIIRKENGEFKMYGTPWHGAFHGIAPLAIPLKKIFFLRKSKVNQLVPQNGVIATSKLFARSFPPFWNREGMDFTLDFISQVVSATACYEFGFFPDEKMINDVRCAP
ncbi:hypothetical protein JW935_05400 [candidate division KSB1 bacterium]|nr:hypothetical protein [candidate division KSB1 bacterium]